MDNVFTITFKEKKIKTNTIYRYTIDNENGGLTITERTIKSVIYTNSKKDSGRIMFNKGFSIGINKINRKIASDTVYLPVKDDEYAYDMIKGYCKDKINEAKLKIDKYQRCIDMLSI